MYPTILSIFACGLLGYYLPTNVGAQTTDIPSNYTVNGVTRSFSGQFFVAVDNDTSAILVENRGKLTLTSCSVVKTGDSNDMTNSSFSDLNAAVAVQSNGTLTMHDSVISSYGQSANALHLYESGSSAYIYNSIVSVYDILSHGLYVAGGYLYAENCIITTAGMFSGAISTDMGGGTMVIKNSQAHTLNELAACTYSTGNVTVNGLTCTTEQAFAGVIDGNNTLSITNSNISAAPEMYGVYRVFSSGNSTPSTTGEINVSNTHIAETRGLHAVFQTSNGNSIIHLHNVTMDAKSGNLFNISAADTGSPGENGGHALFNLTDMTVAGNTLLDAISSIEIELVNTSLTGAINKANTGGSATLVLGPGSKWNVTSTSYLRVLEYIHSSQIIRNHHNVYVNGTLMSS